MTDKSSHQEAELPTAPGKMLRDKREKLGLSQADIAERMHLSVQTVKDLEADDYTHFSAAIYVRGYIRSFAAIVGLSSEPLLESFVKMGFVEQLNKQPRTSYIASSVTKVVQMQYSKRRMAKWVSYSFFGFLMLLVVIWWHGQRNHKHAVISANILSAVTQAADSRSVRVTTTTLTATNAASSATLTSNPAPQVESSTALTPSTAAQVAVAPSTTLTSSTSAHTPSTTLTSHVAHHHASSAISTSHNTTILPPPSAVMPSQENAVTPSLHVNSEAP